MHYEHADVIFNLPEDWEDRTITAFAAPLKTGQKIAPNIVLTRDAVKNIEPASAYADRQLVDLAKRLDGFSLHWRREVMMDGLPAVELLFTWNSNNAVFKQKQVFVVVRERTVLSFTVTALMDDFPVVEPIFNQIFEGIKFPRIKSGGL